jgi:hypothetical protein
LFVATWGGIMSVGPISAASLSAYVLSSNDSEEQNQALQNVQSSLSNGDLTGAQSAFSSLQTLFQSAATASGSSLSSQLADNLNALGSALSAGDLSTAQSAFTALQSYLKTSSPALSNEAGAASQSVALVEELLSTVDASTASSGASDPNSLLQSLYGGSGGLNLLA